MFHLKKLVAALVLPPTSLILLAFAGLWLARRHPKSGHTMAVLSLAALLALSLPPVADVLNRGLEPASPISEGGLKRAQAIVVLGGGTYYGAPEYGGDTVGVATLERARYAAYLQKRSHLPILVTGGSPYGGRAEGESMKEALERDFGARVTWVESTSNDTAENAVRSAAILKAAHVSRIALISHAWHLKRAAELFRRQGLEVIPAPTRFLTHAPSRLARVLPSAGALAQSAEALHEWLGILVGRLAARMRPV